MGVMNDKESTVREEINVENIAVKMVQVSSLKPKLWTKAEH